LSLEGSGAVTQYSLADGKTVSVALAADDFFAMPLAATLASLIGTLDPGWRLDVTILDGGIRRANARRIEQLASESCSLRWVVPDAEKLGEVVRRVESTYPVASYYRLLLPALLPPQLSRVIYLDTDLVVEESISKLWETDLHGAWTGGVHEGLPRRMITRLAAVDEDQDLDRLYFNAGVLLIDLDAWRSNQATELLLDFIGRHPGELEFADQDALNIVLSDHWMPVPARWNQTSGLRNLAGNSSCLYGSEELAEALTNPAIIHFSEHAKPWLRGSEHPQCDRFFHYLDQTAWSGWRPTVRDDAQRLARRAARRARAEIAWRVRRKRSGKPRGAEPADDSA
jgi:lipopolysaccharide biosynthesis glycosyltransferase